ncbi:AMP-binding protein [Candidatus Saccharibacteria bacterium]|nr:AMP-binding protein [Candidatus Saccharibacteria bacterium]
MAKPKAPWHNVYHDIRKHLRYPNSSLYARVAEAAKKFPDRPALNYFGKDISYAELMERIDDVTRALLAYGIGEGDTITICMPNTPEAVAMFYAANRVGAIASMIHPLSAENAIRQYLEISNSKMMLTIDMALEKIENIISDTRVKKVIVASAGSSMPVVKKNTYKYIVARGQKKPVESNRFTTWKNFILHGIDVPIKITAKVGGKDVAVILYSGGTTGEPKGILLTNNAINAAALQGFEFLGDIDENDSLLAILPIFHGFGLCICIHLVLSYGACSTLIPQFSVDSFHKLLNKYQPTVLIGVPTLFEALLKNKHMKKIDLSYLRYIISGGDALSSELKRRVDEFLHEHGCFEQVREGYGMTEAVTAVAFMPAGEYRDDSVGVPFPDNYIKIVRPFTQDELPYGEVGEICVTGPTLMLGYLDDEEETHKVLQKHADGHTWLHSGDLATMDEDGFIYFKQRLKRMIVSSGYNIYPQYIERIINGYEGVLISTVIGVSHPYKGMVAKAFVVTHEKVSANEKFKRGLREHCKQNLAKYEIPAQFVFRKSLPRTLVGKINVRELEDEENPEKKPES